jgi:hypothetical protein
MYLLLLLNKKFNALLTNSFLFQINIKYYRKNLQNTGKKLLKNVKRNLMPTITTSISFPRKTVKDSE